MKYLVSLCCCLTLLSCNRNNSPSSLPAETELYNTQWLFKAFEIVGDTIEPLPSNHQYFLIFREVLQGETDSECINTYVGRYTIRPPDSISIHDIVSTRAYCRESYWRYLYQLGRSATYDIVGTSLYLWSEDKKTRLIFTRIQ